MEDSVRETLASFFRGLNKCLSREVLAGPWLHSRDLSFILDGAPMNLTQSLFRRALDLRQRPKPPHGPLHLDGTARLSHQIEPDPLGSVISFTLQRYDSPQAPLDLCLSRP